MLAYCRVSSGDNVNIDEEKSMTIIDDIQPSDKEAVCLWFRQFLQDHLKWWKGCYHTHVAPKEGLDEKQWLMLTQAQTDPLQLVKIARNDMGAPIGIIWAVIKDDEWFECRIGQIYWMAIAFDSKKRGVGTQLMQVTEAWFQSMHVQGKRLFVSTANEPAIQLYRKFGYAVSDYRMLAPGPSTRI